jgi:predicted esterase
VLLHRAAGTRTIGRSPHRARRRAREERARLLCAASLVLAACSSGPEAPRAHPRSAPDRVLAEPAQSGSEAPPAPEPPPPDASALANGRALVLPGADGFVTTWQVLSRREVPADEEARLGVCADCPVRAFDHFRLELGDLAAPGSRTVYVGATLLVPRDTRAFALVGMRGAAAVLLDGERVAEGASAERFERDFVLAPLALSRGEHRFVVRFDRPEDGEWRGSIRMLGERFSPGPGGVAIALGTIDEETRAELALAAVRVDEEHVLDASRVPSVRVRAFLPGGALARPALLHIGDEEVVLSPERSLHASAHEALFPMPERGGMRLTARIGERSVRLGVNLSSDRAALESAAALRALVATAPESARAPIAWRAAELERLVREGDGDSTWRGVLRSDAQRIARAVGRGEDPFARIRGYERMAFFSALDGTPQEYELFVPPAYRAGADRRWPLVVTLHGFKGNAGDFFRNTFGLARDYDNDESLIAHGRYGPEPTSGPMFVIAPTGRGQSFYRHAGEIDVLEAMADVRRRFPEIDPARVYITGGSMGGTGAAYLPYRHPDLFAASAALAGYHDQRVREDTEHDGLTEVERFLQAERSDVDWAENGLYLPMLLVRGLRDRPLEWTRCLVRRLGALGYACEHREPDLGHNVWNETYANGRIFEWFARHRRPDAPERVILRSARERTQRAYWVSVDQRLAPDAFAHVDATLASGVVSATIDGAQAVTFAPPPPLVAEGARITVRVGESAIEGAVPLTIERTPEGSWQRATRTYPEEGARRPGLSGPIREIFHEPLAFVIGTQDPDHELANRLVAEHWSQPHGWIVSYPIVRDVDVTDAMMHERSLVLIGPPSSNSVLARIADRLPIRFESDAIVVGTQAHRGEQVGTAFIAPNPLAGGRLVLVLAGLRPAGTWRAIALPDILPDYVVYDDRVAPARGRWACGGTGCTYRAHGFFDMRWRVPSPPE